MGNVYGDSSCVFKMGKIQKQFINHIRKRASVKALLNAMVVTSILYVLEIKKKASELNRI